jgi:hypothetical protein
MQATMNVQPLSFDDRYPYQARTSFSSSSFSSEELQEDLHEYPLSRKKHPLLSFDEALDEDYDLDEYVEEDEEEEEETPRRRRYLTEQEYQREAVDYTRQQLKQSGLYYKHAYHFWRLGSGDSFSRVRPHLVKFLIAFLVLAIPILLGLFLVEDAPFGSKPDVSMLPDLAHKQDRPTSFEGGANINSGRGSLLNRLLKRAGLQRDNATEALVPAPLTAAHGLDSAKPAPSPVAPHEEGPKASKAEEGKIGQVGLYEEPGLSFTSIIPSMQGMNIFSFAYNAAVDFFSKTFGWEAANNMTAGTGPAHQ